MIRRTLKRLLMPPMVVIAALIMFFEEWLWHHLVTLTAKIARAPIFRRFEAWLAKQSPYTAVIIFLLPGLLLLPVKLAALYFITHHHPGKGLLVIILAKLIGTAIVARLFTVCRPALLTIGWFRRLYEGILRLKTRLYAALRAMPGWAAAIRWKNAIKAMLPRGGFFLRRWKAIGELLRKKFTKR